MVFTEP